MSEMVINDSEDFILNSIDLQKKAVEDKKTCSILYISGRPGIGKSDFVAQLCKKHGFGLIVKYMGTMLVEQITGLPTGSQNITNGGAMNWSKPELFSMNNFKVECTNPYTDTVVLLLDDVHLCTKAIQSYMFQLLSYRCIHDHVLNKNMVVILAGNRSSDKAGFQPILAPITNRIFFLDVMSTVQDWVDNFAKPYNVRDEIVHYLLLNETSFQSEPMESRPWSSPRSWTYASDSLDMIEKTNPTKLVGPGGIDNLLTLMSGHVGLENATKFVEFVQIIRKWPGRKILDGVMQLPTGLNRIDYYALSSSIILEFLKMIEPYKNDPPTDIVKRFYSQLEIMKTLLNNMCTECKEIVPYAAKSLIFSGKQSAATSAIIMSLWSNNPTLLGAIKTMMGKG